MSALMPSPLRILLGILLLTGLAAGPALAAPIDAAYTVRGLMVDVSAANPIQAREQAFAEAQATGFRKAMERVTQPSDHSRLPQLPLSEIEQYVRDISVEQEKSLAQRYIGSLTVRFQPAAMRKLLKDNGIAFAEPRQRPVVVVPIFYTGERSVLWEDGNSWRDAFASAARAPEGLVSFAVPSHAQAADFNATSALGGDPGPLNQLAGRYNTTEALLTLAASGKDAQGRPLLDVRLVSTVGVLPKPFDQRSYIGAEGEKPEDLMKKAVADIARGLEEAHKAGNTVRFDQAGDLAAIVPLDGSLDSWLAVRDRLARASVVRGYDIISLSKDEAALILRYAGDQAQLETALAQNGLGLTWMDSYWVMQARPAAAAGGR